jgi:hypothetical protein
MMVQKTLQGCGSHYCLRVLKFVWPPSIFSELRASSSNHFKRSNPACTSGPIDQSVTFLLCPSRSSKPQTRLHLFKIKKIQARGMQDRDDDELRLLRRPRRIAA